MDENLDDIRQITADLAAQLEAVNRKIRLIQQGLAAIGAPAKKGKSGPVEINVNGRKHRI